VSRKQKLPKRLAALSLRIKRVQIEFPWGMVLSTSEVRQFVSVLRPKMPESML